MIFLEGKVYAKVWNVKPAQNGKYIDLQVTTSEKVENGEYVNSSWFPRCIGKAVNTLKNVKHGDKIVIKKLKFTNERQKQDDDTYKSYFKFLILDAEFDNGDDGSTNSTSTSAPTETKKANGTPIKESKAETSTTEEDEDCPW